MNSLYLNTSIPRRRFKDLLGNANHLLVTILVGLHGIEKEIITEEPAELRAAWNPLDRKQSAARARALVLEMALVRATDAIDAYLTWCRRKPSLIQDASFASAIDAAGQSVFGKFNAMKTHVKQLDPTICALVETVIVWRNRVVHSVADNEVSKDSLATLSEKKEWIRENFRGMDVDRLLSGFRKSNAPTFKEVASFIRAAQLFVECADEALIRRIDTERYMKEMISSYLNQVDGEGRAVGRNKLAQSVWGKDSESKQRRVRSLLLNCGFADAKSNEWSAEFDANTIAVIAKMCPKEILMYCGNPVSSP